MPKVTFIQKSEKPLTIDATEGRTLMHIATDEGLEGIDGVCGGCLACATCHLYIHPDWQARVSAESEQEQDEIDMLDLALNVTDASRLGCQIEMSNALDGLVIAIPGAEVEW